MKLFILLENADHESDTIQAGLKGIPVQVERDSGRTVLITDSIFPEPLNVDDHEQIHSLWNKVRELVAIMDGAGQLEGTLPRMALLNLAYEAGDGARKWMPITGRGDMVTQSARTRPPDGAPYIGLALNDPAVAKALRLF